MRILAGTSGYAYKEWKGVFYPEDLPNDQMLHSYAEKLPTVEINNTFYRLPSASVLQGWAEQVPEGFTFVIKASRRITHMKRLRDVGEPLSYLLSNLELLGEKLGPILFQLPPNLKYDEARLREFLDLLPVGTKAAMEFRHESWFSERVYEALSAKGLALCTADTEDGETPLLPTSKIGYFRLRRADYTDAALKQWAKRVKEGGYETAYVFFKHEDAGAGPRMAERFLRCAGG